MLTVYFLCVYSTQINKIWVLPSHKFNVAQRRRREEIIFAVEVMLKVYFLCFILHKSTNFGITEGKIQYRTTTHPLNQPLCVLVFNPGHKLCLTDHILLN